MEARLVPRRVARMERKRLWVGEGWAEADEKDQVDRMAAAGAAEEEISRAHHLALVAEKPAAERGLEELVFGDAEEGESLLRRLQGPFAQVGSVVSGNLLEEESDDSEVENEMEDLPCKKPAWVDEDDEDEEIIDMTHRYRKNMVKSDAEKKLIKEKLQRRLQEQFHSAMGATPSWAVRNLKKKVRKDINEDDSEEEEDDLLRKTGNFVTASDSLPRGILQMKNCLPANNERQSDAKLTTVQFHPSAQVVMTAGLDRSVSLFQVDGITNPKIQSIHLEGFPVYKACFSADGEQVIATSVHKKLFYIYDMMAGKIIPINHIRGLEEKIVRKFEVSPDGRFLLFSGSSGYLHLVTMKTKEFVGSMKINGRAAESYFCPDSSKVFTHSLEGEVFIWDVKSRRCLNRFTDEGCLRGTSIAVSKNNQYVACGSSSGVVNVYAQDNCLRETSPKPLKAIMNLVTPATSLSFNSTTEILAMASNKIDEAVKLVHIPSFTVFSNFPVFRRKLIYLANSMDFSPRSGYFSIANSKGKALLYRLKHYSDF
ncbi:U3 small nucleolar RNA-associated protein 18 homolog isoform X2 [Rhineura floridana]|uniref:U3 small nucleolar RNA-associated protein 18 homolog isoform X2 n=1 Tax=Rhineura floridana TaxID=261503 RepID=UPI002AC812E1|nr:U3 small nucleolar RNA-associated protein 18 homolog isoform X2 [Rhineura floridana]